MNLGLKNVYFLAFVRNPKSSAKLKSDKPLFKNLHKKFNQIKMPTKSSALVTCYADA